MSGDESPDHGEDGKNVRFARTPAGEAPEAKERVMSWSAYDLQVRATAHSASCGHPGFVPDDYLKHLNGLGLQATITASELCTVGLWEHTGGGYRIRDREAYCYQHWHVSASGYGCCPQGHGKRLNPHWSP